MTAAYSRRDALGLEWFAYRAPNTVHYKTKVFALPERPAQARLGTYRGPVPTSVVARDFQIATGPLDVRALGLLSADKKHRFAEYAGYDKTIFTTCPSLEALIESAR